MSIAMRKAAAASDGRAGPAAGRALVVFLMAALVPTARPAWLRAQTVDPFAGLVEEALRNNLALEQARLAEARAGAALREARGRLLPSLALDYRYTEQDGTLNFGDLVNPVFGALNELSGANRFPTDVDLTIPFRNDSRLRLVQPLYDSRLWASRALAGHRRDAAHYARRAAARRLAAEVQAAYLSVAAARSAARIYEAGLALVRESERVAGRLVEAGRATPDVVYRARAERGEVEQQLLSARERVHAAERRFNRLMGRGVDAPVEEIPDSLLRFEVSLTEEEAIAHALAHREELFGAASQSAAAEAAVRIASAAFLPRLSLAIDYGFQGNELRFGADEDYFMATIAVSWNLFNGGRDLAARQGAALEAERVELARRDLEERIRLEVGEAYEAAVVARAAIETAEARVAAARRTFELVRRRYEEGVASQVEFVDARSALTAAELNRSVTAYRYAVRCVELERAAALRVMDAG